VKTATEAVLDAAIADGRLAPEHKPVHRKHHERDVRIALEAALAVDGPVRLIVAEQIEGAVWADGEWSETPPTPLYRAVPVTQETPTP
jgi:hypothetical protein